MQPHPRCEGDGQWARTGFTVIEALIVLVIVATVVGALTPSVARQLTHARINRAANVIAGDFFLAQGLAGRRRTPIVLRFDDVRKTLTISDTRTPFAVYVTRDFGLQSDFKLPQFTASATSVMVLPNGMANQAVTVTIGGSGYQRRIKMSRAGQIRIL